MKRLLLLALLFAAPAQAMIVKITQVTTATTINGIVVNCMVCGSGDVKSIIYVREQAVGLCADHIKSDNKKTPLEEVRDSVLAQQVLNKSVPLRAEEDKSL